MTAEVAVTIVSSQSEPQATRASDVGSSAFAAINFDTSSATAIRPSTVIASAVPVANRTSSNQLLHAFDQALAELDHDSESSHWSIDEIGPRRDQESDSPSNASLAVEWIEWE